jgi:hypothetical protein
LCIRSARSNSGDRRDQSAVKLQLNTSQSPVSNSPVGQRATNDQSPARQPSGNSQSPVTKKSDRSQSPVGQQSENYQSTVRQLQDCSQSPVRQQLENSQSPARQLQHGIQSPISQQSDLDTSGDLSSASTSTELFYTSDISENVSSASGTFEELSSAGDTSRDLFSATDTSFASETPEDLHFGGENSENSFRLLQEETDSYCSAISWLPDQSLTCANESGDNSSTNKISRLTRPIVIGGERTRDEPGRADERGDERAEKRMTRKVSDRSTTCASPGPSAGLAVSDQEPVC